MSRRRGEFEHRTSIFEGAFRAWSHLGGLNPEDLETQTTTDLDPLTNPLDNNDPRLIAQRKAGDIKDLTNPDGSARRWYPYEPLPRSGLAHPYVQAILSPWLGPDADNDAIQLGLTTLRTWWQHRRKGESGSAIAALGTEKMKGVVEGYTRHFFTLAHCLVVNDKEQPPRTLHGRMKELEKLRNKQRKKKGQVDEKGPQPGGPMGDLVNEIRGDLTDTTLSPLERLHQAQQRNLASSGMLHPSMPASTQVDVTNNAPPANMAQPTVPLKGKCIPGKLDLAGVVDAVNHAANQLVHRGSGYSGPGVPPAVKPQTMPSSQQAQPMNQYGDPSTTPVVFVSSKGDIMISMAIDGITCAHCVKIVETVLRGCSGNKSPIEGLLDAAADRVLNSVLIKIDKATNAKRVSFEAARNLSMVGYTAKVKELSIMGPDKKTMDLGALSTAFEVVATTDPEDFFDWSQPCTCPDNGVLRADCARHSQMNTRIFESFESREKQVMDYMAGSGVKYGGDAVAVNDPAQPSALAGAASAPSTVPEYIGGSMADIMGDEEPIHVEQKMEFFGLEPGPQAPRNQLQPPAPRMVSTAETINALGSLSPHDIANTNDGTGGVVISGMPPRRQSYRNQSLMAGFGSMRNMSVTSEATFGRAMSGLSALSIDWETLQDFDVNVDYSANINGSSPMTMNRMSVVGNNPGAGGDPLMMNDRRRSSFRRLPSGGDNEPHVSFKV